MYFSVYVHFSVQLLPLRVPVWWAGHCTVLWCIVCSGGISLKPAFDMDKMRGDMGGAACVVGAILASALLKLPINIKGELAESCVCVSIIMSR